MIFLTLLLSLAQASDRPFWTEKSQYVEGDKVYFVGVASKAKTVEEGRETALKNAEKEMQNYFRMSDISGITFKTQMTYEEKQKDGTTSVWRLMFLAESELGKIKEQKQALVSQSAKTEKSLEDAKKILANYHEEKRDISEKILMVRVGMKIKEVLGIMGEPTTNDIEYNKFGNLHYRDCRIFFMNGLVERIQYCSN